MQENEEVGVCMNDEDGDGDRVVVAVLGMVLEVFLDVFLKGGEHTSCSLSAINLVARY